MTTPTIALPSTVSSRLSAYEVRRIVRPWKFTEVSALMLTDASDIW